MQTRVGQNIDLLSQIAQKILGDGKYLAVSRHYGGQQPWLIPPPDANPFDANNSAILGTVGTITEIVNFVVPIGDDGVLNGFSIQYLASAFDAGDLIFRLFVDDRPVKNYERMFMNMGSTEIPRSTNVRLYSGNVVKLVAEHAANITLDGKEVIGTLKGYTYSRTQSLQ